MRLQTFESFTVIPNYWLLPFFPGILYKPTKEKRSAVAASNPVFLPLLPQHRDALQAIYVTSMNYLQ